MKYFIFASALVLTVALDSCKTTATVQNNSAFNIEDLYKTWMVDTIVVLNPDLPSTPDIETVKNTYEFKKDGSDLNQGIRKTITSMASFETSYTIENGTFHFNPAATFPAIKFDKNGKPLSANLYATIPNYKIIELTPDRLTLQGEEIMVKLKAK